MRIGQLASRGDTLVETIRYYERVGLLPAPPRTPSRYRQYGAEHLKKLRFVRRCRRLGFSIMEIRSLLSLAEQQDQSCAQVMQMAETHLKAVKTKLAELRRLERSLRELVDSCAGGRIGACRILEAMTTEVREARSLQASRMHEPG